MFKAASRQLRFEDAQFQCGGLLDPDSFYAKLGEHGHNWILDADYASMYSADRGRNCVPPSILVRASLLQCYRPCSDRELVERIRFDLRYKVALGVSVDYRGFDPSLLAVFRSRLILHGKERSAFTSTVQHAQKAGLVGDCQPVDSMPIFGATAVQDTYTLLRTGIEKLLGALRRQRDEWKGSRGFKYPFTSKKYKKGAGKPDIDWNNEQERRRYLNELVKDGAALVEAVESSSMAHAGRVQTALEILKRLLVQDVEPDTESGDFKIKRGGKDRIISTDDPESRHGHKTSSKLIDGYKGHFLVSEDEIVTNLAVTAANVPDSGPVPDMVAELKEQGVAPKTMPADCAYGGADFRAEMESQGVEVLAKVPQAPSTGRFSKSDFKVDLESMKVTCPAEKTTVNHRETKDDKQRTVPTFRFDASQCADCPLRSKCIPDSAKFREVKLHANEDQLQKAKAKAAEPDFRQEMKRRLVVERVQARLQSYGLKVSRYRGLSKTLLQATLTATVNNMWKLASKTLTRGSP